MPRKALPSRKAKAALLALQLEAARREAVAARRDHHAREAALALRKATPDWVDLDAQLKQAQLESEMDAMEAAIEARKPNIPILNFDLMPGIDPPKSAPEPDKITSANENKPPRPNPKGWAYPGTLDDRDPADDWRNYE
jgi:hypothetical protein